MKFWLPPGDKIFLYQLLKAAGLETDYAKIRNIIKNGEVMVNEQVTTHQRHEVKIGDTVRCHQQHIKIVASDPQPGAPVIEKIKPALEAVMHGKAQAWRVSTLQSDPELEKQVEHACQGVHNKLSAVGFTLACAESCTGGMLQEIITTLPGSSRYFLGGIVSYSDQIKERLLKVKPETLARKGAVSRQTALEMARGVQALFVSNIGCSITGIAGPDGGSQGKPVGTVHLAVAYNDLLTHRKFNFSGDRNSIRLQSCLEMLLILEKIIDRR